MPPRGRRKQTPESTSSVQSPRRRSSRRADFSGLDLDPENDDEEYSDQLPANDEGDDSIVKDEEEEEDEEDEEVVVSTRKRGRSVDKDDGDKEPGSEEDSAASASEGEAEEPEQGTEAKPIDRRFGPKKRGRKKTKLTVTEDGYYDENGNVLNIVNDEVSMENEDPKGKEKIDENGNLLGGRKFRVKSFTVIGQGDRKYMVSTEPARLVGFRDSYLLFKTHPKLFKRVCTHEEKMDLIERNIIPNSYKGRSVNLVTSRSIYREFGAKILEDGKKVTDDFWEQKARDNGDKEGEYADPSELYNYNMIKTNGLESNNPAATITNNQPTPISGAAVVSYQTDPTWMYQIAMQTRDYNTKLLEARSQAFKGLKDIYTGLNFYPSSTQSTKHKLEKIKDTNDGSIVVDTKFSNADLRKKVTGLLTLSPSILKEVESEVGDDVRQQIEYETSL